MLLIVQVTLLLKLPFWMILILASSLVYWHLSYFCRHLLCVCVCVWVVFGGCVGCVCVFKYIRFVLLLLFTFPQCTVIFYHFLRYSVYRSFGIVLFAFTLQSFLSFAAHLFISLFCSLLYSVGYWHCSSLICCFCNYTYCTDLSILQILLPCLSPLCIF